ncbi:hypothetical protein [Phenylobacterium sp.]|jgi:hypothetical protein|uniref:hypothetical protein n=1 Tax=Phenylobacterium sp. TaxID=1871053 RepID=UPI0037839791
MTPAKKRGCTPAVELREFHVPYLCYVHRISGGVPHFEVLPDVDHAEAMTMAAAILTQRRDGLRAELWQDDVLVGAVAAARTAEVAA